MTDRELDEILTFYWPRVVRRVMVDGDEWSRGFAKSIARNAKRPNWRPSEEQSYLMRSMVEDLRSEPGQQLELIER